jgi:predicted RND superfamily exporter protein
MKRACAVVVWGLWATFLGFTVLLCCLLSFVIVWQLGVFWLIRIVGIALFLVLLLPKIVAWAYRNK